MHLTQSRAREQSNKGFPTISLMIGLWIKWSGSHHFFIMLFFFFFFYVVSLDCILILADNVSGLFDIFFSLFIFPFFSHSLPWFHCYSAMLIYFYYFIAMWTWLWISCFLVLDFVPKFELWKSCMWQFVVKKHWKSSYWITDMVKWHFSCAIVF